MGPTKAGMIGDLDRFCCQTQYRKNRERFCKEQEDNTIYVGKDALHRTLKFIGDVISNYQYEREDVKHLITSHKTNYVQINKEEILEASHDTAFEIENLLTLYSIVKSARKENKNEMNIISETLQNLQKQCNEITENLKNLRSLKKILSPIIEKYKSEPLLSFKKKLEQSQKKYDYNTMSVEDSKAFWEFAKLPIELKDNLNKINPGELGYLLESDLEEELGMKSIQAKKRFFYNVDLLTNAQFLKLTAKKGASKMFAPALHKKHCAVCRHDSFEKVKMLLKEYDCESCFDVSLLAEFKIFGEELTYVTKEDFVKIFKTPRSKLPELVPKLEIWKEIHKKALEQNK